MSREIEIKLTAQGKKLMKELKKLEQLEVCAGFQHGAACEDDGTDICDIAARNEFGTENIPSRPFIRDAVDNKSNGVGEALQQQLTALINGESTVEVVCNTAGVAMKSAIQKEIKNGTFEPNAPSTIRKKGSSKPLIDTGRMRQSVQYVVREKGSGSE